MSGAFGFERAGMMPRITLRALSPDVVILADGRLRTAADLKEVETVWEKLRITGCFSVRL